jgi:hypothetical protein
MERLGVRRKLKDWAAKIAPQATVSTWLQIIVPTWIAFGFFLAIGPQIEQSLASTLTTRAPSLYAAVFGEGLIRSPDFLPWIFGGFDPGIWLIALLVTIISFNAETPQRAALRAAISCSILLIIADGLIIVLFGNQTPFTEAALFDVLSIPFVWFFFITIFMILEQCRSSLKPHVPERLSYWMLAVGLAIAISALAYGLFNLFYVPGPVSFVTIVSSPTEGFFVSGREDGPRTEERSTSPMSILPPGSLARRAFITSPGGQMKVHWRKTAAASRFRAEITFYADCPYPENIDDLPPGQPSLTLNPSELSLTFSQGISQLTIGHTGTRAYNLKVPALAYYWIKGAPGKPIDSIAAFIVPEDQINIDPTSGISFYLGGPLSTISNHTSRPAAKSLDMVANGQKYTFSAGGEHLVFNQALRCRPIRDAFIAHGTDGTLHVSSKTGGSLFNLGALIKLTNEPVPVDVYQIEQSTFAVTDANGWAEVFGFDFERMTDHTLGKGRGFSATRNITRLVVDGQPQTLADTDDILVVGDFEATYDDRSIQLSGTADALWQNNRRLNPTLWERLSGLWQIPFLTAFLAVLAFIARRFIPAIAAFLGRDQRLI